MTGTLWELVLAVAIFVAGHAVLSGPALRPRLVRVLGERWFQAVYSVVSLGLLWWAI